MISTTFILEGQVIPKKNSRRLFYKKGRIINIPSKSYQEWHDDDLKQIKIWKVPKLNPPYKLSLSFWFKDKRPKDLDNSLASICDLLQDAEVIQDDDAKLLTETHCYYKGVSKESPRVKIDISAEYDKPGDSYVKLAID